MVNTGHILDSIFNILLRLEETTINANSVKKKNNDKIIEKNKIWDETSSKFTLVCKYVPTQAFFKIKF